MHKFLISHGSAGTFWLEDTLINDITKIPHDISNFKFGCGTHLKSPNCLIEKYGNNAKILYPIRHPIETLMSYVRRGFFVSRAHCFHVGGNVNNWYRFSDSIQPLKRKKDISFVLEKLANVDYEIFEIKDHILSWYDCDLDVKFVAYPDIPQRWKEITDYLGSNAKEAIHGWKEKKCDLRNLQKDTLEKLCEKYKKAIKIYEKVKI